MKRFARKSALIGYVFFTIHTLHAQPIPTRLDGLFSQVSTDPQIHFNGVVLVADKDDIIYQNALGFSNISTEQKNTVQTRFQLASSRKFLQPRPLCSWLKKEPFNWMIR